MDKLHFLKGIHIPFTNWGLEVLSVRGVVDWVESETGRGYTFIEGDTDLSDKEEEKRDY